VARLGKRRRPYRGRISPGGSLSQHWAQLINEVAWATLSKLDTNVQYAAWARRWRKAGKAERDALFREIWSPFSAAVNDQREAAPTLARLQKRCTDAQISLLLNVAIGPEIPAPLNQVLPPALRVRRPPRRSWGPWNSRPWGRAYSGLARSIVGVEPSISWVQVRIAETTSLAEVIADTAAVEGPISAPASMLHGRSGNDR
jgi:hypothetical protein